MRILLLSILTLIPFFSFSQEVEKRHYLSANMAWSRQSFFSSNYGFQLIEPSVGYGYFVKKNMAFGVDVLYSNTLLRQDVNLHFLPDTFDYSMRYTGAKGFGIAPNVFIKVPFKKSWAFMFKGSIPVIAYKEDVWTDRTDRASTTLHSSYVAVCVDASIGLQYEFPSGAAIQFTPFRMNMMGYKKGDTSTYESRTLLQAALGAYLRF